LASFLGEYCSDSICGSIGLQIEVALEVGLDEDWFPTHEGFEHFEHFELWFAPMPHYTFLCQIQEWMGNLGVIGDEVAVVASEAQERADVSRIFGYWPICYTTQLLGVHLQLVFPNYYFKVVDLFLFKGAFFGFEVEVMLF